MLSVEPLIQAAVSVAPMPFCSVCCCAEANTLALARCVALLSRFVFSLHAACCSPYTVTAGLSSPSRQCFTTVSTAIALPLLRAPRLPSRPTAQIGAAGPRCESSLHCSCARDQHPSRRRSRSARRLPTEGETHPPCT